jgi:16S rRNA (uracil1498-N3)-methyltransferase
MSYFLSAQVLKLNNEVEIQGEEARHILLARRMKKGQSINLQGADEKRFRVVIVDINKNSLKLKVVESISVPVEAKVKITLFQSYVNEKALDFIFQKGTELGVFKIVLFNSQNTATKLSKEGFLKKQERWNKILWEAAKQSDRVRPPTLEFLENLDSIISSAKKLDKVLLCDIAGEPVKNLGNLDQSFKSCAIIIGPEGGFIQEEIAQIIKLPNSVSVSLGPILLRAETAALAALSIVRNLVA